MLAALNGVSLAKRDDRPQVPFLAGVIDRTVVVAHIQGGSLDCKAARARSVKESRRKEGFTLSGALDLPGKRESGSGTDGGVELVAVEAAALASRNCRTVAPGSIGVREPFALATALADEPLAVRVGGKV